MSAELATSYAALILTDDNVEITVKYRSNNQQPTSNNHPHPPMARSQATLPLDGWFLSLPEIGWIDISDKLQTLLKAANVEVESIWTSLFAKALEGKDVAAMLSNVGAAGSAPAAGAAAPAGGAAAAEEKAEEKKEEAKEESDDDMGFGLFD
ncbi:MAG: 60S acidic ribosomal protein p1 [Linnemannia elongata]|nr:MAG: 60S acidic ribosomal protein p1 [Linnemannia elongata]